MRTSVAIVLSGFLVAACGPSQADKQQQAADEALRDFQQRISSELDCEQSVVRFLCDLGEVEPGVVPVPDEVERRVGLTVVLRDSRKVESAALETATLSVLIWGPEGADVQAVRASNPGERDVLGAMATQLSMASKGTTKKVRLPEDLQRALAQLPARPGAWVGTPGGMFTQQEPTTVYRAASSAAGGSTLITLAQGEGGVFLSFFPDVPGATIDPATVVEPAEPMAQAADDQP